MMNLVLIFTWLSHLRLNLWLGFIVLVAFISLQVALTEVKGKFFSEIISFCLLSVFAFYFLGKLYIRNFKFFALTSRNRKLEIQICIIFLSVAFVGCLIPLIHNPWFLNLEYRVNYLSEASIFLRGVKIAPILLLPLLFLMINRKNYTLIFALYLVFCIFFGSKSGIFFLIMHLTLLKTIGQFDFTKHKLFIILAGGSALSIIASLFFLLAQENGVSLLQVFGERFMSDVTGYIIVLDGLSQSCKDYSIFNPVFGFLSKVTLSGQVDYHLSLGKCLAAPDDLAYDFELLLPLYFELSYLYGDFGVIILLFLLACHWFLISLLVSITPAQLRVLKASICAYGFFTLISIFFGGKYFNWFVSEYITILVLLVAIRIFLQLAPMRMIKC